MRKLFEPARFSLEIPVLAIVVLMMLVPVLGMPNYPGNSVVALGVGPDGSLPDALDAFYAYPVNPGQVVVMWLGNGVGQWMTEPSSGFLLKTREKVALIDPGAIISGDTVQKVQRLDILLITHEHTDHFSKLAVVSLQSKTGVIVVMNPGAYNQIGTSIPSEKLVRMRSGDARVILDIEVRAIASVHPGNEPLMYIVSFSDFSVFHGSDSGFNSALNTYTGQAKLCLVPTGGASPTASPNDALKMVKALGCSTAIPMHGTEAQNDQLETLLAQQSPAVHYLRPQAISSVVVDELSGVGFTLIASVTGLFYILTRSKTVPVLNSARSPTSKPILL